MAVYSTRDQAKLRFAIRLARAGDNRITLADISRDMACSLSYCEQMVYELKSVGLVDGRRGPRGGFVFKKPIDKITVCDLLDTRKKAIGTDDSDIDKFEGLLRSFMKKIKLSDII